MSVLVNYSVKKCCFFLIEHNGHTDSSACQAGIWTGFDGPSIAAPDGTENEKTQGKESGYRTLVLFLKKTTPQYKVILCTDIGMMTCTFTFV